MPSSHSFFPIHLKRRFIYDCPLSTSFHHFSAVDICLFSTIRVCTTLVTRNVANRQRFSSRSSYLKLQIRPVYFVTQQFSSLKRKRRRNTETKRIKKTHPQRPRRRRRHLKSRTQYLALWGMKAEDGKMY